MPAASAARKTTSHGQSPRPPPKVCHVPSPTTGPSSFLHQRPQLPPGAPRVSLLKVYRNGAHGSGPDVCRKLRGGPRLMRRARGRRLRRTRPGRNVDPRRGPGPCARAAALRRPRASLRRPGRRRGTTSPSEEIEHRPRMVGDAAVALPRIGIGASERRGRAAAEGLRVFAASAREGAPWPTRELVPTMPGPDPSRRRPVAPRVRPGERRRDSHELEVAVEAGRGGERRLDHPRCRSSRSVSETDTGSAPPAT